MGRLMATELVDDEHEQVTDASHEHVMNALDMMNGGTLERAQHMAAHASSRTTSLYNRANDSVTLDEVERILI